MMVYYLKTAAQELVGVGGWIGDLVNLIGELVNPNLLNLQLFLTKSTKSSLLQSEKTNKEIMLKLRYSQKATKL